MAPRAQRSEAGAVGIRRGFGSGAWGWTTAYHDKDAGNAVAPGTVGIGKS
jgi:formate dehydrogenase iron-sulfur subunit